jgi:hypothetical protein
MMNGLNGLDMLNGMNARNRLAVLCVGPVRILVLGLS